VHFFQNYKKVEIEALIWEAAVKDFELKTLKSQLNPHFMFNALNSIRALIEEEPASAKIAVTKLSNILRYSLRIEKSETVTLEDEMQTVVDYLDLEKIRFEERLNYSIKLEEKAARTEIPPMMVQTLVENGIKHGISKITDGGKIFVNSFVEDSKLHIQISNTGQLSEEDLKNATGFGIQNTKHRLNLLYGETGSFKINNINKKEVFAEVIIPTGGKINESFNSR
jgi:LytS/YehU family sensor histidine kinase